MRRAFKLGFGRGHVQRDVDEELAFHIDMRTERLVASGMAPEAARAEALRQFGAITPIRESCVAYDEDRERITRRLMIIEDFLQDLAYAARTLRRNPGFTLVVALTIALGVGANTAIFTLVDAVMLRTLDVPHPERLVAIGDPARTGGLSEGTPRGDLFSYALYQDVVRESGVTTGILASGRVGRLNVVTAPGQEVEHPRARFVSGNYFEVLGLRAGAGRTFTAADDRLGAPPVVVISDDYWARRFDRSRDAVGRTIRINDAAATIVGVAPRGWKGEIVGDALDLWIPLSTQPALMPNRNLLESREQSWLLLLGRLRPGITVEQARRRLGPLVQQLLIAGMSEITPGNRTSAERVRERPLYVSSGARGFSYLRSTFAAPLLTLMAGVALLLLIVCANVANLILARSVARGREMSVRLAIGAGRGRLVRQLLTESLVLALLGAAGGLLLASWGARLLLAFANQTTRTVRVEALDVRVLAFTVAVSLLAVALFGLAPALGASRIDLASSLRAGARSLLSANRGAARRSPASLLIGVQVALSLLLLIGTGLLVRSLQQLQRTDPGLDRDRLLIVEVDPATGAGYRAERLQTLARELSERFARLPGVAAVSWSGNGIFSGTESMNTLQVEGFHATQDDDSVAHTDQVGPNYVSALGGRLLAGRDLSARDDAAAPRVALVNETFAHFYFPRGDAIGKRLRFDTLDATIVGVVGDIKDHELRSEPVRRAYVAYAQPTLGEPTSLIFEVRAVRDPAALAKAVRAEITAVDPGLSIYGVDPLAQLMQDSIRQERLLARLSLAFGTLALVLASVGLFGVMSYAVTRRTGELGVRVALGAQRSQVLRMVLWDALRIVLGGMAVGLPVALLAARLLRTQLYGVGATDPLALAAAVAVLLVSGAVASLAPALRASRVAPSVALRAE